MNNNIFIELEKFKNFLFDENLHFYFYFDEAGELKKLKYSVTTIISKFAPLFERDKWAKIKAEEKGITKEEVLREWSEINKQSLDRGSLIHKYIELRMQNKFNSSFKIDAKEGEMIDNFIFKTRQRLIPVKSEVVIGDIEYSIGGMIDQLFIDLKNNELYIFDWKTGKEIKKENEFEKMLPPFDFLDNCNFNHYCLQLQYYKYILEKNTNLKIKDCYFVHLNKEIEVFKTKEISKKVLEEALKIILKGNEK